MLGVAASAELLVDWRSLALHLVGGLEIAQHFDGTEGQSHFPDQFGTSVARSNAGAAVQILYFRSSEFLSRLRVSLLISFEGTE